MRLHFLDLLFSSSLSLMMYFSKADNYDGFYWLKLNVFFLSLAKALEFLMKEWSLEKRWSYYYNNDYVTRGTTPTNVNISAIISPLILRSIGASIFNEGDKFTSSSQGLEFWSMRISKPNNEKQLDLNGTYFI